MSLYITRSCLSQGTGTTLHKFKKWTNLAEQDKRPIIHTFTSNIGTELCSFKSLCKLLISFNFWCQIFALLLLTCNLSSTKFFSGGLDSQETKFWAAGAWRWWSPWGLWHFPVPSCRGERTDRWGQWRRESRLLQQQPQPSGERDSLLTGRACYSGWQGVARFDRGKGNWQLSFTVILPKYQKSKSPGHMRPGPWKSCHPREEK